AVFLLAARRIVATISAGEASAIVEKRRLRAGARAEPKAKAVFLLAARRIVAIDLGEGASRQFGNDLLMMSLCDRSPCTPEQSRLT
mgnify:CR=1